ncbi:MAG: hypothetical protein KKC84_07410, partial [Candidatus Omnitrophica bacterium]|nr:hypothetical protein [Candidatus Omnitrophota bacterium]
DKRGRYCKDVIGLENERVPGEPLLRKVLAKGTVILKSPSLEKIRVRTKTDLSRVPSALLATYPRYRYPVEVSAQLKQMLRTLANKP